MDSNIKFHLVPLIIIILAVIFRIFTPSAETAVKGTAVTGAVKENKTGVKKESPEGVKEKTWWVEPKDKTIKKMSSISQSEPINLVLKSIDYSKKGEMDSFIKLFALDYICKREYPSVWDELPDDKKKSIKEVNELVIGKNIKNVIPADVTYEPQFLESIDNKAKVELLYSGKDSGASKIIKLIKSGEEWKIYSLPGVIE